MFCTSEQKFFELNGFMPPKRCRGCCAEQREKRERKQSRATREREPFLRCGVWRNTALYRKGDLVSHDRSLFICQQDSPTCRPADDSGHWRLAVMRGRDGKDLR